MEFGLSDNDGKVARGGVKKVNEIRVTVCCLCSKNNLGSHSSFVARQIDSNGIVFDAYVFP